MEVHLAVPDPDPAAVMHPQATILSVAMLGSGHLLGFDRGILQHSQTARNAVALFSGKTDQRVLHCDFDGPHDGARFAAAWLWCAATCWCSRLLQLALPALLMLLVPFHHCRRRFHTPCCRLDFSQPSRAGPRLTVSPPLRQASSRRQTTGRYTIRSLLRRPAVWPVRAAAGSLRCPRPATTTMQPAHASTLSLTCAHHGIHAARGRQQHRQRSYACPSPALFSPSASPHPTIDRAGRVACVRAQRLTDGWQTQWRHQ